jgi:hypothetical protein
MPEDASITGHQWDIASQKQQLTCLPGSTPPAEADSAAIAKEAKILRPLTAAE